MDDDRPTEQDPLVRLAASIDGLVTKLDETLAAVKANKADLVITRGDLRTWQRALVVLAVMLVTSVTAGTVVVSYGRQVDCDRSNETRRIYNEGTEPDLPLRDCAWPS